LLLLIDTSGPTAFVALSRGGRILFSEENPLAKEHASWLHPAIGRLMEQAGAENSGASPEAVAISAGPGSYTGLRVGMAAAKGICYALKIPLITVNTLQLMAEAMVPLAKEKHALICPMIDARREEVFTALYAADMREIRAPQALILEKTSFDEILRENLVLFSGSGSEKWKMLTSSKNAIFITQIDVKESLATISAHYFEEKKWTELIHSAPIYLKEFYTHSKI
jgi:tRNA threonylcarbamoyladenosine biosynthesis protein TsaB